MSKFNMNITLNICENKIYDVYQKVFEEFDFSNRVVLAREELGERLFQGIVVPFPSAFGLYDKGSMTDVIIKFLQKDDMNGGLVERIRQYILKRYLGEQPLGSAFILPIENKKFNYVVVVPLFRLSISIHSDSIEIDKGIIPLDFAYNATRGLLLTVLRHNASNTKKIETLYFPDFFSFRAEALNDIFLMDESAEECARQVALAIEGVLFPSRKVKTLQDALQLQNSLYTSDYNITNTGVTEERIKSMTDLDNLISKANSEDADTSLLGCKALASALKSKRQNEKDLPKTEIAKRICEKETGCFDILLNHIVHGHITVHDEIPISEITFSSKIGHGTSGSVYSGFYNQKPIAIKEFNDDFTFEEVMRELSIMSMLEHPNLVRCFGGITNRKMLIIQELLHVNLFDLLHSPVDLDLGMRIRIALEVSKGMKYLHENCNLIHRDLKSLNLLIRESDNNIQVRICDFGVSRIVDTKSVMTGNVGTVSWIAPEILGHKKYSEKADVYSFGIILWELLTRAEPFSHLHGFSIPVAVINGERPQIPRSCGKDLKKLIRSCWASKSKKRPTFSKIYESLNRVYKNIPSTEKQQTHIDLSDVNSQFQRNGSVKNSRKKKNRNHESLSSFSDLISDSGKVSVSDSSPSKFSGSSNSKKSDSDNYLKDSDSSMRHKTTVTCKIPHKWSNPIADLEINVNTYFSRLNQNIDRGSLKIMGERYVLFRGHSLSVDFNDSIKRNFSFRDNRDSLDFAQNFLYDMGSSIGKVDATNFLFYNKDYCDKTALDHAAFVFLSYTGIGYVELLEDSIFSEDPLEQVMVFEFLESFEVDSYKKACEIPDGCACIIGSGYISGWGEVMNNSPQATAEILCRARGDDRCLFIRSHPSELASAVDKYCNEKCIIDHQGVPRYLKNRKETRKGNDTKESSDSQDWFRSSYKKILDSTRYSSAPREEDFKDVLSVEDIEERVSEELEKFIIDPRSGSVELADDKCILVRAESLSKGFHSLVQELMVGKPEDVTPFVSNFLYNLGKSIGSSNHDWFVDRIDLQTSIDQAHALPINLQYFGWSHVKFHEAITISKLKKKSEKFITCSTSTSFEANSWRKKTTETSMAPTKTCFMHCGFIAGWFEKCFNIPIACAERTCKALGDKRCTFVIGTPMKLKRILKRTEGDDELYSFALREPELINMLGITRPRSKTTDRNVSPRSNETN